MALHVLGALLFLAGGGVSLYRARWWSRQGFSVEVNYGSHSHGAHQKKQKGSENSWCWALGAIGLLSIACGIWQIVAMILSLG